MVFLLFYVADTVASESRSSFIYRPHHCAIRSVYFYSATIALDSYLVLIDINNETYK
jgi:hypothetical protein